MQSSYSVEQKQYIKGADLGPKILTRLERAEKFLGTKDMYIWKHVANTILQHVDVGNPFTHDSVR